MLIWKLKASRALHPFALAFQPSLVFGRQADKELTLGMDVGRMWKRVAKEEPSSGYYFPPLWKSCPIPQLSCTASFVPASAWCPFRRFQLCSTVWAFSLF